MVRLLLLGALLLLEHAAGNVLHVATDGGWGMEAVNPVGREGSGDGSSG